MFGDLFGYFQIIKLPNCARRTKIYFPKRPVDSNQVWELTWMWKQPLIMFVPTGITDIEIFVD